MAAGFVAVILICANTIASTDCTEANALDVLSMGAENELQCTQGWQDLVARSAFGKDVGTTAYIRTRCTRNKDEPPQKIQPR
jgi:hypothetical protein